MMVITPHLAKEYLHWKIDRQKPVTDKFMFGQYRKTGFIETGRTLAELPDLDTWLKIKSIKP